MNKKCSHCKLIRNVDEFYKNSSKDDGLTTECKECVRVSVDVYQATENHQTAIVKYRKTGKHKKTRRNWRQTPKGKYLEYKNASKVKKVCFDISFEEFFKFWQQPCEYCGSEIKTIGLDRVDNDVGYIISNVISCCEFCNRAKRNISRESFLEYIKKIYEKSIK